MAGSSSINPSFIVEVGAHASSPNLVSVKLSGKDKYKLWKTQMLCLLKSHNMLGFIDGKFKNPEGRLMSTAGDIEAWVRSDALVKSWILGSISEQAATYVVDHLTSELTSDADFTAKDAWDELQRIYGSSVLQQAAGGEIEGSSIAEVKSEELHEEIKEDVDIIYEREGDAFEGLRFFLKRGEWGIVLLQLTRTGVNVTDIITTNGNTVLHLAVGSDSCSNEMLEKLLGKAPEKTLLDVRNSDGSTLLHVAAIVGNTKAVDILVGRNRDLLAVKDKEGQIPLATSLSNMHRETSMCLLRHVKDNIDKYPLFSSRSYDELIILAISSQEFGLANDLLDVFKNLKSDAVLMAMAQNNPNLNYWETISIGNDYKYRAQDVRERLEELSCVGLCGNWCQKIWSVVFMGVYLIILVFNGTVKILASPFVKDGIQKYRAAIETLRDVCRSIRRSKDASSYHHYYTNPILEATKQNADVVFTCILEFFPNAVMSINEDGHNLMQCAVIDRSERIYNRLYAMGDLNSVSKTIKDSSRNNLLHLAAKLAPTDKLNLISGAALQLQHELQWYKEVEGFVCPLNITEKNSSQETPQMVFTREHEKLVIEGEKWMKATAESYTITAALITTIVFAAAITVPGGNNQDTGIPIFTNKAAFTVFALADAISLFTAVTSLLMFLSILTARFAEQDFLFKLPTKLIIGLTTLFISTTTMIIAFGATLFIVFGQKNSLILIPIAALACLPIASFVTLQFPLVVDLVSATYGRNTFQK